MKQLLFRQSLFLAVFLYLIASVFVSLIVVLQILLNGIDDDGYGVLLIIGSIAVSSSLFPALTLIPAPLILAALTFHYMAPFYFYFLD